MTPTTPLTGHGPIRSGRTGRAAVSCFRAGVLSLGFLLLPDAAGDAPDLEHLYPSGGARGWSGVVSVVGKWSEWPISAWVEGTGVGFTPREKAGEFDVSVAEDAVPGARLVRLHSGDGASKPRFFIVGDGAEISEVEPNDAFGEPHEIVELPVTVNGRLGKRGDVDSFAVTLEEGQWLTASVEAFTLASTTDAVLHLRDAGGYRLAWNHDNGRTFDPFLAWRAPRAGRYVVQVMGFAYPARADTRLDGGDGYVYRLRLTRGPVVRQLIPPLATRGWDQSVRLLGWNLDRAGVGSVVDFGSSDLAVARESVPLPIEGVDTAPELRLTDVAVRVWEPEPEGTPAIESPGSHLGRLGSGDDEDRYLLRAEAGERLRLEVRSRALGFATDLRLSVQGQDGKELASGDDDDGLDPALSWTAKESGEYVVVVGTALRSTSDDEGWYQLDVSGVAPDFRLSVADHALAFEAGSTNEVTIAVERLDGYAGGVRVFSDDLPVGVRAEPVEVAPDAKEAKLTLVVSGDVPPGGSIVSFRGEDPETGRRRTAFHSLVSTGTNNGVPQGYHDLVIDRTERIWLALKPAPAPVDAGAADAGKEEESSTGP